jgi:hypothetical protein
MIVILTQGHTGDWKFSVFPILALKPERSGIEFGFTFAPSTGTEGDQNYNWTFAGPGGATNSETYLRCSQDIRRLKRGMQSVFDRDRRAFRHRCAEHPAEFEVS